MAERCAEYWQNKLHIVTDGDDARLEHCSTWPIEQDVFSQAAHFEQEYRRRLTEDWPTYRNWGQGNG